MCNLSGTPKIIIYLCKTELRLGITTFKCIIKEKDNGR